MNNSVLEEIEKKGFNVLESVDSSGQSQCFKVRERNKEALLFLKVVNSARYLRELNALTANDSSCTCNPVDSFYISSEICMLIFPWIDGGSLRDYLEQSAFGKDFDIYAFSRSLFRALEAMHETGLVHGDLKPDNLLIADSGDVENSLLISDFGSSAFIGELRQKAWRAASPCYESPESVQGQATFASDLYSAGVLLYEAVTGKRPYVGMPSEIFRMSVYENPPLSSIEDIRFRYLLARLLATDLSTRPTSAAEALTILNQDCTLESVVAPPQSRSMPDLRILLSRYRDRRAVSVCSDSTAQYFCFFDQNCLRIVNQSSEEVVSHPYFGSHPLWKSGFLWFWLGSDLYRFSLSVMKTEHVGFFRFPPQAYDIYNDSVIWFSAGVLLSADLNGNIRSRTNIEGFVTSHHLVSVAGCNYVSGGSTGSTLLIFDSEMKLKSSIALPGMILDLCSGLGECVHALVESFHVCNQLLFMTISVDGFVQEAYFSKQIRNVALSHQGCVIWEESGAIRVLEPTGRAIRETVSASVVH